MMPIRRILIAATASLVALGLPAMACAQTFPTKTVKIVVPYPPGGTNDVVARLLSTRLTEQLGQTVFVENQAGASGNTGTGNVARSAADGYTLILVTTGLAIAPSLYPKLSYDIRKDLAPVSQLTSGPLLVMVNPKLPVNNVRELLEMARARPGQLNYGSAGNGASTHLAVEAMTATAGVKMTHIPYKGSTPAMSDVMAGNADLVLDLMFSGMPNVMSGKLKAIGVTGLERSPALPDVPTVSEAGIPGFEVIAWNGLMVPAGTPKDVIAKLNTEIAKAMNRPDMQERMLSQGFYVTTGTPDQFGTLINNEIDRWQKVVQASGAKID